MVRRRGKAEDRVQVPDGPLDRRAGMPLGATDPCKVGVMGSTPMRSTEDKWADRPTGRHRPGVAEIRVRLPSAYGSMVKRTSCLASNEMFQVRILVGLLMKRELNKRKGNPIGDGTRLEAGRA